MTTFSIDALYLDSMSSSDESVIRACRSKSSFATSISRSLCCSVRFESRKTVISFSRAFCAAFASALDSLYFLFHSSTSKLRASAFSLRAFSLFSAASRSFSSSFSSSSLDTLNSASSVSSCSYWALYQASDPSDDASPPGGDDGGSGAAMTGELLERQEAMKS